MEIELTQGKVAIVDDADFEWLSEHKWFALPETNTWHAARDSHRDKIGRRHKIRMHREILDAQPDQRVGHISGDGLDNRRENLCFRTRSQSNANQRKQRGASSQYKGVSWEKLVAKWRAGIMRNGRPFYLGLFDDEVEAAEAHDAKARELYGPFAALNFPRDGERSAI